MEVKVIKSEGSGLGEMISKAMGASDENKSAGTIRIDGDSCIDGKVGEEVTLTIKAKFKSDVAGDNGSPRSQSFDIVEITGRKRCRCGSGSEKGMCTECGKKEADCDCDDDASETPENKAGRKMQMISRRGRV